MSSNPTLKRQHSDEEEDSAKKKKEELQEPEKTPMLKRQRDGDEEPPHPAKKMKEELQEQQNPLEIEKEKEETPGVVFPHIPDEKWKTMTRKEKHALWMARKGFDPASKPKKPKRKREKPIADDSVTAPRSEAEWRALPEEERKEIRRQRNRKLALAKNAAAKEASK